MLIQKDMLPQQIFFLGKSMRICNCQKMKQNLFNMKENSLEKHHQKENLKDIGTVFLAKNYTVYRSI